ncbi:hypothetical protein Tco_0897960 [Tanacetum coccineum]
MKTPQLLMPWLWSRCKETGVTLGVPMHRDYDSAGEISPGNLVTMIKLLRKLKIEAKNDVNEKTLRCQDDDRAAGAEAGRRAAGGRGVRGLEFRWLPDGRWMDIQLGDTRGWRMVGVTHQGTGHTSSGVRRGKCGAQARTRGQWVDGGHTGRGGRLNATMGGSEVQSAVVERATVAAPMEHEVGRGPRRGPRANVRGAEESLVYEGRERWESGRGEGRPLRRGSLGDTSPVESRHEPSRVKTGEPGPSRSTRRGQPGLTEVGVTTAVRMHVGGGDGTGHRGTESVSWGRCGFTRRRLVGVGNRRGSGVVTKAWDTLAAGVSGRAHTEVGVRLGVQGGGWHVTGTEQRKMSLRAGAVRTQVFSEWGATPCATSGTAALQMGGSLTSRRSAGLWAITEQFEWCRGEREGGGQGSPSWGMSLGLWPRG